MARPDEDQVEAFNIVATKSRNGEPITLREIQPIRRKEGLVTLPGTSNLSQVVETLGSGVHRFLVTDQEGDAVGIMSQLRMVEFFWNEGVNFASIDQLYPAILRDLGVGTKDAISIK